MTEPLTPEAERALRRDIEQGGPVTPGDMLALLATLDAARSAATPNGLRGIDWPTLANVIREVDGDHDLGAGELAERILAHPFLAAATPPAAPDGLPTVEALATAIDVVGTAKQDDTDWSVTRPKTPRELAEDILAALRGQSNG